ncbi:hypothetical protein K492DRAFT_177269 [Lichtheimia hyalospora FSU 10163]|nr:hypothetical protein K492DRAFT_177269 [Lichtheimia hyalospora FSU 10163]
MDFADLSNYDDILTDIFLDGLFLWFKTTKMNAMRRRRPRIPSNKVLDIIQRNILMEKSPSDAIAEFLQMDYFKHYIASKSVKQQQEFVQHMKRYLYMYMPSAGYELSDTRRYYKHQDRRVPQPCLVATKDWHVGQELRFCTGTLTGLKPKESAQMCKNRRDIGVVWSPRKGCSCVFLGPARFINHDCDANCKFISTGQNSVAFRVVKEIKCGDELTAYYGNHYYGENNYDCRCATCERQGEGYFSTNHETNNNVSMSKKEDGKMKASRKRKSALHQEDYLADTLLFDQEHNEPVIKNKRRKSSVMSIDFLCGNQGQEPKSGEKIPTSPLDLLCDAVMDAEYINVENKEQHQQEPKALTVLVDQKNVNAVSISMYYPGPSPVSDDEIKADSAVSVSPTPHGHVWKEEVSSSSDEGAEEETPLDDILDDISDLSSVASSELEEWSDLDGNISSNSSNNSNSNGGKQSQRKASNSRKEENDKDGPLQCIACQRELRREEISEQLGCDTSITADLVTWTWTPSALFTDWRPKRCPRCERHYAIFCQEWPNRRQRKSIIGSTQDTSIKNSIPSVKRKSSTTTSTRKFSSSPPSLPNKKINKKKATSTIPSSQPSSSASPTPSQSEKPVTLQDQDAIDELFLYESPLTPLSEFGGDEEELLGL